MLGKKYYQFLTFGYVACGNAGVTYHINFPTILRSFEKQITEIFACKLNKDRPTDVTCFIFCSTFFEC